MDRLQAILVELIRLFLVIPDHSLVLEAAASEVQEKTA